MSDTAGDNLSTSMARLIEKMEKMYERQAAESSQTENMLALLDRLSVILDRVENGKSIEAEIGRKMELLNQHLERTADFQERLARGQEGAEGTFNRAINGVRMFGMILSTLASSVQLAVDNISQVLGKNPDGASPASDSHRAARTQADLAAILQPVSTLVKNLVEEKMKQQDQCPNRDKVEPEDTSGEKSEKVPL